MKALNNKTIDYIFIVLLLLNGGTIIKIFGFTAIFQLITVFIMFLCIVLNGRFFIKKTVFTIFILVTGLFLMNFIHYFIANDYIFFSNQLLNFIVLITIGVFTSNQFLNRTDDFIFHLNKVLKILIIHGIISCLILNLFPTKNLLFKEVTGGAGYVGYNYLLFIRTNILETGAIAQDKVNVLGYMLRRAHGYFWEPGVFATFINIYVFINFFVYKNLNSLKYSTLSLILSWSTTGIFVFLIQSIIFFNSYKRGNKNVIIKKYLFGSVIFLFLFFTITQNFNNKIYGDDAGSAAQRYADTFGALSIVSNNPLFGIGIEFNNLSKQFESSNLDFDNTIGGNFRNINRNESKFSNSLLRIFVYFGIPLGLFLMYSLYNQQLIPNKRWLFFIIIVFSVFSSPILFLGFYFSFIISGLRQTIPILRLHS